MLFNNLLMLSIEENHDHDLPHDSCGHRGNHHWWILWAVNKHQKNQNASKICKELLDGLLRHYSEEELLYRAANHAYHDIPKCHRVRCKFINFNSIPFHFCPSVSFIFLHSLVTIKDTYVYV